MRLRLVHTLSILLVSAVVIAVVSMAAVTAWNLKNGFADYLRARDVERLEKFAALVGDAAQQAGGIEALRSRIPSMRQLIDEFAEALELPNRRPPRHVAEPRKGGGDGFPKRQPPSGVDGFGPRVIVVTPDGNPIFHRPPSSNAGETIDRPIFVNGAVVALARLRESEQVPDATEARFLRNQYIGILAVSACLTLLALVSAWWFAKRWVRPLQLAQHATARIARGEFDVRADEHPTDAKRGDEIDDLLRDINQMAESLQRLEHSRRRWLADISHELRTPLAGLRGDIEALVDGVRPLKHDAVVSLREKAIQLGALVDDLHLLAMSDLKALPCHFSDVDAVAIVQQTVMRFAARARSVGLSLDADLSGIATLVACWDKTRIDQLLGNVLENSLRYTDSPGKILLTLTHVESSISISVDDSAPGVSETDYAHLFEPLFRAHSSSNRHRGGSGLGLAICEAIARSHGGRISASKSRFGGLCVRVDLPFSAESTS
jgi:two-component system, OmpR family, sensor histidine kinase BaeS